MSNILNKIQLSGTTYDLVDSSAVHSLEGYATEQYVTAATNALAESIASQHYQTSGDVQNAISGKADSDDVYTKQQTDEKIAQASGTTTGQVQTMINQSISGKANSSDVITRLGNHYGEEGKAGIDVTKGGTTSTMYIITAGTGVNISSGNGISIDTDVVAQKSDIPSVSGYADAVKYDTNTKNMKFYHGGTGGTEVFSFDASPFLIDGMVQNVEIKDVAGSGTCLVISFNTDAGKQDINIPISTIFDASNYYTKAEVDGELSGKTNNSTFTAYTASTATEIGNKADTTAMTQAISEATSGKVDNSTYTAYTAATDAAIAGKANTADVITNVSIDTEYDSDNGPKLKYTKNGSDVYEGFLYQTGNGLKYRKNSREISVDTNTIQEKLVSGTSIKTVGGESLLGSGNISFPAGLQVQVTGTTLVFG